MHSHVTVPARPNAQASSTLSAPSQRRSPSHRAEGRARIVGRSSSLTEASGPSLAKRATTATGLTLAAVVSTAALSLGVAAEPAAAYPAGMTSAQKAQYERQIDHRNYQVYRMARDLVGVKYRYGGTSVGSGFDCSGYVRYIYNKVGKPLPRTSSQMEASVHKISQASAKTGDLVFFHGRGGVYHVGIYVQGGYVYHAPGSGERVQLERIWTSSISFGRV